MASSALLLFHEKVVRGSDEQLRHDHTMRRQAKEERSGLIAEPPVEDTKVDVDDDERVDEDVEDIIDHDSEQEHSQFDREVERIGIGWFHYIAVSILGLGNAADAVELLAISYILPELPDEITDTQKGFVSAAVFIGMLIGGLVCGFISDYIGRKPCLLVSLAINGFFGLLSALSPNWQLLVTFRILSGIGVGGSVPSVFTLAAEYLPPTRRGFFITMVAWWWMVGSIMTACLAWITMGALDLSWPWFAALASIPAWLGFALAWFYLPESPRFLYTIKDFKGTAETLNWIARQCQRPPTLSKDGSELDEDSDDAATDTLINGHEREGWKERLLRLWNGEVVEGKDSLKALFHPSLLRTTITTIAVWWTISFGWYGLILWIPSIISKSGFSIGLYADTFLVAASNLPGNIISALLMDRLGRRNVLAGSMAISAALAILLAFFESPGYTVTIVCIFNAVSVGGWNSLDCLSTEAFPTSLRASAMGLQAAFGRLGSIAAQFVNGSLIDQSVAILLMCTSGVMFVGCGTALLIPVEPANKKLKDSVHK